MNITEFMKYIDLIPGSEWCEIEYRARRKTPLVKVLSEDFWNENDVPEEMKNDVPEEMKTIEVTVEESCGGEGMGDEFWLVLRVHLDEDHLIRKDGWYASYDGGYYDGDLNEVEAREVTRTEYFII